MKTNPLLTLFLCVCSTVLQAQHAGELDTTFSGGMVVTDLDELDGVYDMAIQPDGKIIVVGFSGNNGEGSSEERMASFYGGAVVARYHANGMLDGSFGTGGVVTTGFHDTDPAKAVALQSDGKIVVAGLSETERGAGELTVVRYLSNGVLDSTFNRMEPTDSGMFENVFMEVQSNDKIVIAGGKKAPAALRLIVCSADGAIENIHDEPAGGLFCTVHSMAIQPDNKIMVGALRFIEYMHDDFLFDLTLMRFNTDGTTDNSFGNNGSVVTQSDSTYAQVFPIAIQSDGKILASERMRSGRIALARYFANGVLDSSFVFGGKLESDTGAFQLIRALTVQPDGKIIAAGDCPNLKQHILTRYHANGSVDTTFGTRGEVIVRFPYQGGDNYITALAMQPGGNIVVAGGTGFVMCCHFYSAHFDLLLARYQSGAKTKPDKQRVAGNISFSQLKIPVNGINGIYSAEYTLPKADKITIELFEDSGKWVTTLIANERRAKGAHSETLGSGETIPTGRYFIKLSTTGGSACAWTKVIKKADPFPGQRKK